MTKKPTKKQLQRELDIEAARDAGRGWHKDHVEQVLVDVHRHASKVYDKDGLGKAFVIAFVEGFTQARLRRDAWLQEKRGAAE